MVEMRPIIRDLYHVGLAVGMVLLILGLVTWSGFIKCLDIPGWCDVYYGVKGPPKTLIVFGPEGLGDPDLLADALRDPNGAHASNISRQEIDYVSAGNLKQFDLVIVTRARQMKTDQLESFMEYVDAGGRLVWTGDAGTQLTKDDEYLYRDEIDSNFFLNETIDDPSEVPTHELISPWARKDSEERKQVRFDHYLSVEYRGNYCQIKKGCLINQQIGTLVPESGADHKLVYGISQNLKLYGNFAVVEDIGIGSTRVLSVDTQSILFDSNHSEYGRVFPIIVSSGVGEKVVYYAIPPELLTLPPMSYSLFIENLYNGMLR